MQVFFVFFLVKDSGKSWTVSQRRDKAEARRVTGINPAAERQGRLDFSKERTSRALLPVGSGTLAAARSRPGLTRR